MSTTTRKLCRSKTPMSSVSGITLLIRIIWYRSKAKINLLFGYTSPETISTCKPAFHLPHELVEMIIDHLIHDLRALKACSLTCYSWYIAAVPYLHHTITFKERKLGIARAELKPLLKLHKLGILPLAREVRVCQSRELPPWFVPPAFSHLDVHRFSAFTNVQKLQLERLDIFSFIPEAERYFGQFSPTLRSIALFAPRCTPRQLSYFLSLFSDLDDVEIRGFSLPPGTTPDTEFVPVSPPRLRGRLVISSFREVETWKDLMTSCGGLRFHDMDLRNVADCAPVLLEACSETLETLRFFPVDAIARAPQSSLSNFDLSRLEVLRSLHFKVRTVPLGRNGEARDALVEVFSTITSPSFSEVVVVLENKDISGVLSRVPLFDTLREMHNVRPFNLVFSLVVLDFLEVEARQKLVEVLDSAAAKRRLNFLGPPPTIRSRSRRPGS